MYSLVMKAITELVKRCLFLIISHQTVFEQNRLALQKQMYQLNLPFQFHSPHLFQKTLQGYNVEQFLYGKSQERIFFLNFKEIRNILHMKFCLTMWLEYRVNNKNSFIYRVQWRIEKPLTMLAMTTASGQQKASYQGFREQ